MVEKMEVCSLCEGSGLRIVQENGRQVARPCECRVQRRAARMLDRARIPKRFEGATLDLNGIRSPGRKLSDAYLLARKFVEGYPVETGETGLLIAGSIGVGKSHLAVGILRGLITERGVTGLFCDYRDLLKQVQNSYNPSVAATELQVLRPVFEAEVLVLDELGASKPSEWVWDTVAHILNTRYNERKMTIITTNYPNLGPQETDIAPEHGLEPESPARKAARAAMRDETLGDRIGERMRSRLQEMCFVVEIYGKDLRQKEKRATFAGGAKQAIVELPQLTPEAAASAAIELKLEEPSSDLIRKHAKKLAIVTPELPIGEKENTQNPPKVLVNGRLEEMITLPEADSDRSPQLLDDTPVGRAKMGSKWATPEPKRVAETDWRKG